MRKGIIALFALMVVLACGSNNTFAKSKESNANTGASKVETSKVETNKVETSSVEVLYMYGKQRCATCIAIGTETETVVKEFDSDKVIMKTVDISTPEGEKIADKYEVASSSLLVVKDGKVENLTAMSFQYAKNKPAQFRKNLEATIKKMLD